VIAIQNARTIATRWAVEAHFPQSASVCLDLGIMLGNFRACELRNAPLMPLNSGPSAACNGKPCDLCYSVADRDQKHPAFSAATQADTRDLTKWHVDHAAHS
jgi:hypothetical protein